MSRRVFSLEQLWAAVKLIDSAPLFTAGLAYPVNGIVMGGLDWLFSMIAMWAANFACVGLIRAFAMNGGSVTLGKIWWALAAFMGTQVITGILRFESKTGVWKVLRRKKPDAKAS